MQSTGKQASEASDKEVQAANKYYAYPLDHWVPGGRDPVPEVCWRCRLGKLSEARSMRASPVFIQIQEVHQ